MSSTSQHISFVVRDLMYQCGLKQQQFCKIVGIDEKIFSPMLLGKILWDIEAVFKIAVTFKISLDRLIIGKSADNYTTRQSSSHWSEWTEGRRAQRMGFGRRMNDETYSWLTFKTNIPKSSLKKILTGHKVYTKRYKQLIAIQKVKEALNTKAIYF